MALVGGAALALWFGGGTPLGAVIFRLWPAFLNTLQAGVQRRIAPELWDWVFLPVLEAPSWLVPAALGALLLLAGLARRR
ncbi:hypothetical protein [Falsiroseomonas tokyonensis]|uniref:Uncharacterized protein n=1 Tax=Falsiroseomonas tokyonensis TaxID=430521 RepID=A0ABV7BXQ6_9PROT|nr:hypothetical protein [Falsiroseomonas tokyonensis]MBU8540054.1 hypothetical protein [Falsiroseomonas tokyonensis]